MPTGAAKGMTGKEVAVPPEKHPSLPLSQQTARAIPFICDSAECQHSPLPWSATGHYNTCNPGSIVVSDGLHCFAGIGQAGFLHESIVTGGGYASMQIKVFTWVNTMLGNVKKAIHRTYHSVSRKHLPRYLAEFCFRFNQRFNLGSMVGTLVRAAVNSNPIPQRILKLAEKWC